MDIFPLGIDISKAKFAVALLRDDGKLRHKVFPNTAAGYQQLSDWLAKHKAFPIHACLEATGTYGDALALYLHEAGCVVSVINPAIIKAFASTEMSRTKTDKTDASLIAPYCQNITPGHGRLRPLKSASYKLSCADWMRLRGCGSKKATAWRQALVPHR